MKIIFRAEYCMEFGGIMDEEMYNDIISIIENGDYEIYTEKGRNGEDKLFGIILTLADPEYLFYIIRSINNELGRDCTFLANPEQYDMEIEISR